MTEPTSASGVQIPWLAVRATATKRFDIQCFRPGQRELIEAALTGRDAIGVLPTGAGKSLCFQLPSLFLRGAVVVVSPLIALMHDQVQRLQSANIEAARLDSTVAPADQEVQELSRKRGVRVATANPPGACCSIAWKTNASAASSSVARGPGRRMR